MTTEERRKAPRHKLRFQLEIRGTKHETGFSDQAELINISRGGFSFTLLGQKTLPYQEGQEIEIEIILPGPSAVQRRMGIKGRVTRLSLTKINKDDKKQQLLISVQFLNHFKLFRVDARKKALRQSSDGKE